MPFIRSISGLRATTDDCLTPEIVADYCRGFASFLPDGPIIIGMDGRPSGNWIIKNVAEELSSKGRQVKILGIVPTPTVQLYVEQSDAAGGIVVTASHNPAEWNGLKFLNSDGVFLDKDENEAFWDIVDNKKFSSTIDKRQEAILIEDAIEGHIETVLKSDAFSDDFLDRIRSKKLKVVVDAVNASGSKAVPMLLEEFGCEVVKLFCDESGEFPHTPEPIPANLGELSKKVVENNADLGIAVDPDADRLVLIDEKGNPIGEEKTIVLAVKAVLGNIVAFGAEKGAGVVVNHSTTRAVEDVCYDYGITVERSPVGEINVVKKMKETGAVIGGEGSGGVILPSCHYGRDSLVGIALLMLLLSREDKPLSKIAGTLPKYEMIKLKKDFTGDISHIIDKFSSIYSDSDLLIEDGVKAVYPDCWVQLRASNTEPIVRIIAEAPTKGAATDLAYKVMGVI